MRYWATLHGMASLPLQSSNYPSHVSALTIRRNDLPDPEENEQYSQRHKYRMEEQELSMERVRVSGQARSCMEHKHRTRKYKRRYFRGHLAAHSLEGMM